MNPSNLIILPSNASLPSHKPFLWERKERTLLVNAVLFAILFFSAVGQVVADSASWASLKEETLGIQLRYPSEWRVQRSSGQVVLSNVDQLSDESVETLANESSFVISIQLGRNPQRLPIDKWFKQTNVEGNMSSPPEHMSLVTVGDRPAVYIEYSGIGHWATYFVAIKNDVLEISYPVSQPRFADTYSKILKSMKLK